MLDNKTIKKISDYSYHLEGGKMPIIQISERIVVVTRFYNFIAGLPQLTLLEGDLNRFHVNLFSMWLAAKGYSLAENKRQMGYLKAYFEHLVESGELDKSPFDTD